jgi:PRC-barrel domain
MDDLGERRSYLTVEKGVPVYSSDGEKLGRVVRVMSAPEADMFDGVVFDTTAGPGGHRFVDAPEVGEIFERGLVLRLDAAQAASLQPPAANPGSLAVNPADLGGARRGALGRIWDRLSGKG